MHKIAPRGVYTSGKGSSAVGLTAYITRDPDSKQLVLERYVIDFGLIVVKGARLTKLYILVERLYFRMEEYAVSMNSTR